MMWINDDGIQLSAILEKAVTEEAEGGEKQKRPLAILLHGFTSAKDRPHNILAAAAMRGAGFDTLRFDLYGHGESGGEFRKHTLFKWISNTLAVIDYARALGYTELVLSGHSQGGLVAALTAGMEADRVRGLVLRAPAFMIPQGARDGCLLGRPFDSEHIPDTFPVIKGLELDGNYIRTAQAIRVEDAAERFKKPVLILHGDEDDTVPLAVSREMAVRYENCELAVMAGETHHFDRCPDQMRDIIRNWLAKQR